MNIAANLLLYFAAKRQLVLGALFCWR